MCFRTWHICWIVLSLSGLLIACDSKELPPPAQAPRSLFQTNFMAGDTFKVSLRNSLACPVKVSFKGWEAFADAVPAAQMAALDSQVVAQLIISPPDSAAFAQALKLSYTWGEPETVKPDPAARYVWPFPKGKRYKIMQAYNGKFSHQSDFSRYAVDFDMAVGDTVCAMREGVVVGIVDGNTIGGNHRRYRPYANYITLYHADGVLTQYAHLHPGSPMVALGDSVLKGTPLALSGETGWRSAPHLHVNVLKPVQGGAVSIPVVFEQMAGSKISRGMWVRH
ncbi:MAG: M23 family metallopeptidase [Bacteroidota bacterium]